MKHPILMLLEVVALGALATRAAFRRGRDPRKRAHRALKGEQDTLIRELADGDFARVTGKVGALQALQLSPVDQRPCIGFRLVVGTAIRSDPSNGFAEVMIRESCQSFSISDETGMALVEGPFMIGLDVDDSSWTDLPDTLFKVLDDAGVPSNMTNLRFSEAFLLPGDRVTVLGTVNVSVHPAGKRRGFRDPPMMPRIVGTTQSPVVLRDAAEDPPVTSPPTGSSRDPSR